MRILPRPSGQVLGDAIGTLGRVWRPLAFTSLTVFIPMGALTLIVFRSTGATELLERILMDPGYVRGLPPEALREAIAPLFNAALFALVAQGVATVFVFLVAHRLVLAAQAGGPADGRAARAGAVARYLPVLGAATVAFLVVAGLLTAGMMLWSVPLALVGTPNPTSELIAMVLFVALLAPAIWAGVSVSMLTPVMAAERIGVFQALVRSRRLVAGRWWATLGYLLLVGLLGWVAIVMIQLVAIPLSSIGEVGSGFSLVSLFGIVAQGLIVAAVGAMFTGWYIDLRARKEVLLSEDLA